MRSKALYSHNQAVGPIAAVDHVLARTDFDGIDAGQGANGVVTILACDLVHAGMSGNGVIAGAAFHQVTAGGQRIT